MIHYFIFLGLLLTTPMFVLSMNEENEKKLYFQQLDTKKGWKNWNSSASETFFFINNIPNHAISTDIKTIIKNDFIATTQDERNLWNNNPKFNDWNFPATVNDFACLSKKNKKNLFTLRHANRHNAKEHYSIGRVFEKGHPTKSLFIEDKYYDLLLMLPKEIRRKLVDKECPFILTKENTQIMISSNLHRARVTATGITVASMTIPLITEIIYCDYSNLSKVILSGAGLLLSAMVVDLIRAGKYNIDHPLKAEDHFIYSGYIKRPIVPEDLLDF